MHHTPSSPMRLLRSPLGLFYSRATSWLCHSSLARIGNTIQCPLLPPYSTSRTCLYVATLPPNQLDDVENTCLLTPLCMHDSRCLSLTAAVSFYMPSCPALPVEYFSAYLVFPVANVFPAFRNPAPFPETLAPWLFL